MSKNQLTEGRLREIIKEEYINENFEMIMESENLFEASGGTTDAASALGDAIELLETPAGRRLIGQVFRIPYVLNKIPERIPYMLSQTSFEKDKTGFKKFAASIGWLGSGIFKLITKPLAMIGDKIRDMDDSTAKMIVGVIRGKMPDEEGLTDEKLSKAFKELKAVYELHDHGSAETDAAWESIAKELDTTPEDLSKALQKWQNRQKQKAKLFDKGKKEEEGRKENVSEKDQWISNLLKNYDISQAEVEQQWEARVTALEEQPERSIPELDSLIEKWWDDKGRRKKK